jgi:dTDP-glucose 4,6-dehydratase
MLILAWGRTYNLPYIIIRPTNNYGIGQYIEKLIPKTCKYLKLGRKIPLHNSGTPIRNWLHAADTAEAVITIIKNGVQNEIYNICGGFEQTNFKTVEQILTSYGYTVLDKKDIEMFVDFSWNRPGQDVRYALDDSKLRALGWEPKKIFSTELKTIVKYYQDKFIW